MCYLPFPVILYGAYCLGFNVFFAHKILKSIMWAGILGVSFSFQRNIMSNATTIIDSIFLLESGNQLEIRNAYG